MSARRRWRNVLLGCALGAAGTVIAAETQEPDMEFLEYLGLWEESDEEPSLEPRGELLVGKNCDGCGASVPLGSRVGDRCPSCRGVWSYERTVFVNGW